MQPEKTPNSQVPEYNEFKFRGAELLRLLKILDGACINGAGRVALNGRISPAYRDRLLQILDELELAAAKMNRSARSTVSRLGEYAVDCRKEAER